MLGVTSIITQMSKRISSFFILNKIIKEEDKEVYEYSLELLLSSLFNLGAVILIALFTRRVLEAALFVLGFVPLRSFAGGYHASTHFRCFLILLFTFSLFILVTYFIPNNFIVPLTIVFTFSSILLVFFLSPVEDSNKPFSDQEAKKFKKKSRLGILVYSLVTLFISSLFANKIFGLSLVCGVFSVSFSLLASAVRNKIVKRRQLMLK